MKALPKSAHRKAVRLIRIAVSKTKKVFYSSAWGVASDHQRFFAGRGKIDKFAL
jgi:hypothetical protein